MQFCASMQSFAGLGLRNCSTGIVRVLNMDGLRSMRPSFDGLVRATSELSLQVR